MTNRNVDLLADELALPAAVIRKKALDNNLVWMSAFARSYGISLAPHGKTTMSPELMAMQLEHGAWGMTAANIFHARLYADWGIERIIIANQLVGRRSLQTLVALLRDFPEIEIYCLVDSIAGVASLSHALSSVLPRRTIGVLVEIGDVGQRTGVRTTEEGLDVARACNAAPGLALSGVEMFEGVHSDSVASTAHFERFASAIRAIEAEELIESPEFIVSAGGSFFFDQAASVMLAITASRPVRPILRSGCYLTHDHGMYATAHSGILERSLLRVPEGSLQPALEVWAHVQSRPEPRRVIASLGKRHISSDAGMPVPLWQARPGRDLMPVPLEQVTVDRLFDQHACLTIPADCPLVYGDLIGFGISHPCTTFDKWRHLLIVDDAYRVVDQVSTHFGTIG
jgi:D-serine dehydratase